MTAPDSSQDMYVVDARNDHNRLVDMNREIADNSRSIERIDTKLDELLERVRDLETAFTRHRAQRGTL